MKNLFIVAFIFGFVVSCGTENNPLNSDNEARDKTTQVVEVQNPVTGRIWMDRNLGASRAATSPTDSEAYGDLYQWGIEFLPLQSGQPNAIVGVTIIVLFLFLQY
jgi:hypothetical protein